MNQSIAVCGTSNIREDHKHTRYTGNVILNKQTNKQKKQKNKTNKKQLTNNQNPPQKNYKKQTKNNKTNKQKQNKTPAPPKTISERFFLLVFDLLKRIWKVLYHMREVIWP